MKKPEFIIAAAGELFPCDLREIHESGGYICAADAGFLALKEAGITPRLLVGDFDSMDEPECDGVEIIRLPVEKDDTDTVFCVREAARRGFTRVAIYGGLGGERPSHSLANIQLLSFARDLGLRCRLVGGNASVVLLTAGETESISGESGDEISVFAVSDEAEVSLKGLYYGVERVTLSRRFPLGVSNHMISNDASVTVFEGEVVVFTEKRQKEKTKSLL